MEKYIISYECANSAQYRSIMRYIARTEHTLALQAEHEGTRLAVDKSTADTAAACYERNISDVGGAGRGWEVRVREYLTGRIERVHAQGQTDIIASRRSIEVKTRAGWLVNPCFDSRETAEQYMQSTSRPIVGAQYIVYAPETQDAAGNPLNVASACYVMTQRQFLRAAEEAGVIQYKKRQGLWGVAIAQFYQSRKKSNLWLDKLDEYNCYTLQQFKRDVLKLGE
jgi:hypothetical protein